MGARGTLEFRLGDWRENNNIGLESQFPQERRKEETLHSFLKMYSDTRAISCPYLCILLETIIIYLLI